MIEFEPKLVEETVLLAIESAPAARRHRFRLERDKLYQVTDLEERESRFREIHARWFVHLRLGEPLHELLREMSPPAGAAPSFTRSFALRAVSSREEGADLHDSPTGPVLAIKVSPGTLLDRGRLEPMLRRELMHVFDMLDPDFGYSRELPAADGGPSHENMIRERYRVAWDVTVDGRLAARGMLPPGVELMRRREFLSTFSMLSPEAANERFEQLYRPSEGDRTTHGKLSSFVVDPSGARASDRCAVCRFPTRSFRPNPELLHPEVISMIRGDFPAWSPGLGLCLQCADLYEARRAMSAAR